MARVLVVDDEQEIRKGLVTQIPWAEWGVDEVLDSDDGDTALELALRLRPDLIITDIRMPRMSGLQLIENLVRRSYEGDFIVISGFDDFHYAKEAFKLGVSDYLLKPISKDELGKAVAICLQRIRERTALEQNRSFLREGYELAILKMREAALRELISRPTREDQGLRIEHKLQQLDLEWLLGAKLRLLLFGVDSMKALTDEPSANDKDQLLDSVGRILLQTFEESLHDRYVLFRSKDDDWVVLLEDKGEAEPLETVSDAAAERIRAEMKIRVYRSESDSCGTLANVFDMHRKAQASLVYSKVHGSSGDIEEESDPDGRLELHHASSKELVEMMKFETEHEIREVAESFSKLVKSWNVHHPKDLQQRTFEWLLDIFRTAQKSGWKETAWEKNPIVLWERLERFDTLESLKQEVTLLLLQAAESMREQFGSRSQIVHEAQRIILQRYQENLTLQTVAEQVHVTPVWLSKLFKKETEMNFLEYMTDIRLTKAAELLGDLNHKVYQISYMIGYQDPVHFSKLFKRKYGCTPQEYRNSKGNQHE
ncbi:response regulator [Paenibacillus sp. HJGM_3]|uniref:response regulator n=1 Tax=Paenibacillus sp. HJGM_3 TaxID=3379816 RepID=UPI00385AE751